MKKRNILKSILMAMIVISVLLTCFSFAQWTPPDSPPTGFGLEGQATAIIGAIKWIALVVAVIMVVYVGIKYITAGAGTKADVKSNLIPMLVGAILIASSASIVEAIFTLSSID